MKTKEQIMEDSDFIANYKSLVERNLALMVELLCDIRDEQISHNKEMERIGRAEGII